MTYIGVDIGDGDTAVTELCVSNGQPSVSPQALDGMGYAMPSFLWRDPQSGKAVIGRNAVLMPKEGENIELCVNFKNAPGKMSEVELQAFEHRIVLFLDALFSQCGCLQRLWVKAEQEYMLCFGHPTTWTDKDVKLYSEMIKKTRVFSNKDEFFGRQGVKVSLHMCPESHAALLNIVNRQLGKRVSDFREDNDITHWVPEASYMVTVDWGSSTTDITMIENANGRLKIIPDGESGNGQLGARYLDRGIFHAIRKRMSGDELKRLDEYLALNPHYESRIIAFCRFAKETYFNASRHDREQGIMMVPGGLKHFPIETIFPADCTAIMEEVINAPIPEFDNRSWREECRMQIDRVKTYCTKRGCEPSVVYLTGGASKMDFVFEEVVARFPDVRTEIDPYPSVCIANGLAVMPYKLDEAKEFMDEIDQLVDVDIPSVVKGEMSTLADKVAEALTPSVCSVAKDAALSWRSGKISTLNGMESEIKDRIERRLKSDAAKSTINSAIGGFYDKELYPKVFARFEAICLRHKIQPRKFARTAVSVSVSENGCGQKIGGRLGSEGVDGFVNPIDKTLIATVVGIVVAAILTMLGVISVPISTTILFAVIDAMIAVIATTGVFAPVLAPLIVILGVAVVLGGRELLKEKLRVVKIPQTVREFVLSEGKIKSLVDDNAFSIKSDISSGIKKDANFTTKVSASISDGLKTAFSQSAQDLALHIYG